MRARVHFQISGAQTVNTTADTALTIDRIFGKTVPKNAYFLSVSASQPVVAGTMQLIYDVADIAPGLYHGPGRYTLTGKDSTLGHSLSSASYVQFTSPASGFQRKYSVIDEPCTLTVTGEERHGEVHCPKLSASDGSSIDSRITWDLV